MQIFPAPEKIKKVLRGVTALSEKSLYGETIRVTTGLSINESTSTISSVCVPGAGNGNVAVIGVARIISPTQVEVSHGFAGGNANPQTAAVVYWELSYDA